MACIHSAVSIIEFSFLLLSIVSFYYDIVVNMCYWHICMF